MEERGVPWAAVYGNHDDEGSLTRAELMAVQRSCRMCLSEAGPRQVTGVGNYLLTVRSARGVGPAAALYFLDSGSYAPPEVGGYGWIARDQITWFLGASRGLAEVSPAPPSAGSGAAPRVPALAFFHIPLPEYEEVWERRPCRGSKHEAVCCPRVNSGFLDALCQAGDVVGVFVGHDHVNDYEGTLKGLRLCYGRASGFGSYGLEGFPRGARVIRLREGEREFDTWLRLDDGSLVRDPPDHFPQGPVRPGQDCRGASYDP
jgi:hypothetical protein